MTTIHRLRLLCIAAALGLLGLVAGPGCISFSGNADADGGTCSADACGTGQICTSEGRCYTPMPSTTAFGVEVLPKEAGAAQEFVLDGTGTGSTQLQLSGTVKLTGRVLLSSNGEASVAARIIAVRRSQLGGRPDVTTSVDAVAGVRFGAAVPAFELPLVRGQVYDFHIIPGDGVTGAAPNVIRERVFAGDETLDFQVLDGNDAIRVQGQVLSSTAEPLESARVSAHDSVTDELISSVATTSRGGFALAVRRDAQVKSMVLRIEPPENTTRPVVDLGPIALPSRLGEPVLLDAITLPNQQGVLPRITQVTGRGPDGVEQPVANAVVTFSASADDQVVLGGVSMTRKIRYQAVGTTDVAGETMLDLIKGAWTYRLLVVPPAESPYRVYTEEPVVVETAGVGAAVSLLAKPELVGVVRGPDGAAVPNVVIDAQVSLEGAAPYGLEAWLNNPVGLTVTTDMAGGYRLALDPLGKLGEVAGYTLTLRPPDGSGLPRTAYEGVVVSDEAEQSLPLALAEPTLVRGELLDPQGTPVLEAQLRFYLLGTRDGVPSARLISEGSATDGTFQLIVPNQPAGLEP